MGFDTRLLTGEEWISFSLRALYREYGYSLYRMSKFEEYDFYARNKDYLISDNVITFTDAGGKLMALKPDVTLSLVRACRDPEGEAVRKLCYNETVYRVPRHGNAFRELTQAGIECIGAVGDAEIAETLSLAARSLERVSFGAEWRLSVSHLGILTEMLERTGLPPAQRRAALKCVEQKNPHELERLCARCGADGAATAGLLALLRLTGPAQTVLPELRRLEGDSAALSQLERVTAQLGTGAQLDFSIVSDLNYYNGVVFHGYVSGVPAAVLSGGQYDQLMQKLGRASRAIGFAVYVDLLERLAGDGEVEA